MDINNLNPMIFNVILLLALWSVVWKAMVLWVSARRGQTGWFIFFLLVNTAGIVDIIYLLTTKGFDELKSNKTK